MKWTTGGLSVIVVALALGFLLKSCRRPDPDQGKIPAPVEKTIDSLEATRPDFGARRDSAVRVVDGASARAARAERLAKLAKEEAEGFRRAADSLALLAQAQGDSSFLWKVAYDNRTEEADRLRTSLDSTQSALEAKEAARANLDRILRETEARRRQAEEKTIPDLKAAIARLEKPCKVVGFIPCPSRTVVGILGVTAGVVGVVATRK